MATHNKQIKKQTVKERREEAYKFMNRPADDFFNIGNDISIFIWETNEGEFTVIRAFNTDVVGGEKPAVSVDLKGGDWYDLIGWVNHYNMKFRKSD